MLQVFIYVLAKCKIFVIPIFNLKLYIKFLKNNYKFDLFLYKKKNYNIEDCLRESTIFELFMSLCSIIFNL